jgi:hypothetical protein
MGIVQASIGCAFTRTRLPALHAPLEQMRDVELSPYYAQIARCHFCIALSKCG